MSKWMQIFKNKHRGKNDEAWACPGCGSRYGGHHEEHPPNGICTCPSCNPLLPNEEYRKGMDGVDWSKMVSKGHWEATGPGKMKWVKE